MKIHNRTYPLFLALAISLTAVSAFAQDDQSTVGGSITVGGQNGTGIDDS
jgi:hypothetical protein